MLRPQSAKYPSAARQNALEFKPPMPQMRPKLGNNFVEGEDPYS